MWFVYIIQCVEGSLRPSGRKLSLYTGSTNNLEKRFLEHKMGKGGRYTRSHKPVRIVYKEKLNTKSEALKREFEIKKMKRAEKKSLTLKP